MTEPCALGARVDATREATRDLWGSSTVDRVLAALPPDARAPFVRGAQVPRWVPEAYFVAWMNQLWSGPCERDQRGLVRWVDRVTDRGFGAAKRMLLSLASPWVILRRAHSLWRTEHTHGEIAVERLGDRHARLSLRDSTYVDDEVGRHAMAEAFRYHVYRCRTRSAREQHELADNALVVSIEWT